MAETSLTCMNVVTVYLGLGSNLGHREDNLRKALSLLGEGVQITAVSSVYETKPWGYHEQPPFLNLVCAAETTLNPQGLLEMAMAVERRLGRVSTFRYGPRSIDVDVLLYGEEVIDAPGLQVPHPGIPERAFVLVPLAEIASGLVHPSLRRSIGELLAEVPGREGVVRWGTVSP